MHVTSGTVCQASSPCLLALGTEQKTQKSRLLSKRSPCLLQAHEVTAKLLTLRRCALVPIPVLPFHTQGTHAAAGHCHHKCLIPSPSIFSVKKENEQGKSKKVGDIILLSRVLRLFQNDGNPLFASGRSCRRYLAWLPRNQNVLS